MRRYKFLQKEEVFNALNKVRDALLAAHDGNDVEEIMKGILTFDERMKIGRRILIAEYLLAGVPFYEIARLLKVGKTTIGFVGRNLDDYAKCFQLISLRGTRVGKEFDKKAYVKRGGSTLVYQRTEYTGFKRRDVKR